MKKLTTAQIINIALIVLLLIFIGQNLASIPVKFLFFEFELPLIIVILSSVLFGYVTAMVMRKSNRRNNENNEE
jgi:uncharacterized integral membrane protein